MPVGALAQRASVSERRARARNAFTDDKPSPLNGSRMVERQKLRLPVTYHEQDNASNEANSAQNRREWDRMLSLRGHIANRRLQHLLTLGVRETAVRQSDDADCDQDNADYSRRPHRSERSPPLDQLDD